jgi:hypothetical protein
MRMRFNRIVSVIIFLACFTAAKSQDTLYRVDGKVSAVKITKVNNKIVDFLPWDNLDGAEHEISRNKVAYIVYQGGRVESISDTSIKSTPVSKTPPPVAPPVVTKQAEPAPKKAKGADNVSQPPATTQTVAPNTTPPAKPAAAPCPKCDPTASFAVDPAVQLCGFKSNKDAHYKGQKQNTLYVNDPDKKFLNSKQMICLGMDFSFMKVVNEDEVGNAADIKAKDLSRLAGFMNEDPGIYFLSDKFGNGRKVKPQMDKMKASWRNVNEDNWVSADDYQIAPGKIPAIIKAGAYEPKDGIGCVFLVEKFARAQKTLSGYWVIFDFATRNVLVIDHLVYSDVTPPIGAASWYLFWRGALGDAQVWHPFDIEKYTELEKKGQFERVCN